MKPMQGNRLRPLLLIICWLAAAVPSIHAVAGKALPRPAPEFTHQEQASWLNSGPLTMRDLRGKVVLVDFWTFDCWNCYRSFPWLLDLERQMAATDFLVVGVHTPEFEHERQKHRLQDRIKRFGLEHPIMIDNDFSYWNAMGTRYWPSFFLIDKQGQVRAIFVGETHIDSGQAQRIEQLVEQLVKE